MAGHKVVTIPASNLKKSLTEILYNNGFIHRYIFNDDDGPQGTVSIALKYLKPDNAPLIRSMKRVSRPGLRIYKKAGDIPRVIDGLGIAVISTSKGLMNDQDARKQNMRGEVLCYIY